MDNQRFDNLGLIGLKIRQQGVFCKSQGQCQTIVSLTGFLNSKCHVPRKMDGAVLGADLGSVGRAQQQRVVAVPDRLRDAVLDAGGGDADLDAGQPPVCLRPLQEPPNFYPNEKSPFMVFNWYSHQIILRTFVESFRYLSESFLVPRIYYPTPGAGVERGGAETEVH